MVVSACNVACGVIRVIVPLLPIRVEVYFWLIFVSQMIGAVPSSLAAALPSEVSSIFFGEKERSVATSIGAAAQLVGLAGGLAFSGFYIGENSNPTNCVRASAHLFFSN